MKKEFNQKEYINKYKKEHYSTFKVELPKATKKELDEILKLQNLTKSQFLRNAINDLKSKIKKGRD